MGTSTRARSGELPIEDDWTRVKDPKEKKRIQNRVAQRTYRHRMKARLGELQARLDSHEGKHPRSGSDGSDSMTNGQNGSDFGNGNGSLSSDSTDLGQPTTHLPLLQTNVFEQQQQQQQAAVAEMENSIFPQAARLLNSPPNSNGSPQPERPTGKVVTQDLMVDRLRFQTQLLNRLNTLHQDPNLAPDAYPSGTQTAVIDPMGGVAAFPQATAEGMEIPLEPPQVDLWKAQALEQKLRHPGPTPDQNFLAGLTSDPSSTHLAPSLVQQPRPPVVAVANTATLDERFELIMRQAEASGFDNFDDLAIAYYRDNFCEASPMANEQRLSRNRRLPKVISDVFVAATKWTAWERRGLQEEILKSSETMLMAESNRARNSMAAKIGPLMEAQDATSTAEALTSMKKSVQEELPNSWAVSMALAADNRTSWQRDRSNTALATILLLNFAGRIPSDQLLRLIGTCL